MAKAVYHTNLFAPLFKIALGVDEENPMPNLTAYQSDLGWDAITLSRANEGDVFLWAWRDWGTHLLPVCEERWRDLVGVVKHNSIPSTNWYVLRVQKTQAEGPVSGTIEHIGRGNREELIEYVRRILVDVIKQDLTSGAGH